MKLSVQVGLGSGHIVLDPDPVPLPKKGGSPQFSAHICCGQMAAWIQMPLGMAVGLNPSDCVKWGPRFPSPKRANPSFRPLSIVANPPIFGPCLLWPNGWVDQDGIWRGGGPWSRPHCARWGPSCPPQKRGKAPKFSAYFYCGQTAGCIKMPLGIEVELSPGDFVLDGDPAPPPKKAAEPPIFGPCLLWPSGWMDQDATWFGGRPRSRRLCVR